MILTAILTGIVGATVLLGIGQSGIYGRRQGVRLGLIPSDVAISDDTATTIAETGDIVIDETTGQLNYVDSSTKTQTID